MSTLTTTSIPTFLLAAGIEASIIEKYTNDLSSSNPELNKRLLAYFSGQSPHTIPIFIFREQTGEITTIFANQSNVPEEPGEPGSILAYVRQYGFGDSFMHSDCYGQLSCSSCAIEVLQGTLENPTPREEEYDMLDIDDQRPPTELTRLGCQAVIGTEPLVIKIR